MVAQETSYIVKGHAASSLAVFLQELSPVDREVGILNVISFVYILFPKLKYLQISVSCGCSSGSQASKKILIFIASLRSLPGLERVAHGEVTIDEDALVQLERPTLLTSLRRDVSWTKWKDISDDSARTLPF